MLSIACVPAGLVLSVDLSLGPTHIPTPQETPRREDLYLHHVGKQKYKLFAYIMSVIRLQMYLESEPDSKSPPTKWNPLLNRHTTIVSFSCTYLSLLICPKIIQLNIPYSIPPPPHTHTHHITLLLTCPFLHPDASFFPSGDHAMYIIQCL